MGRKKTSTEETESKVRKREATNNKTSHGETKCSNAARYDTVYNKPSKNNAQNNKCNEQTRDNGNETQGTKG